MVCCSAYGSALAKSARQASAPRMCVLYQGAGVLNAPRKPRGVRASSKGVTVVSLEESARGVVQHSSQTPKRTRREVLGLATALTCLPVGEALAAGSCDTLKDGPMGIQYCDAVVGTGQEPFEGDVVKTNYEARLADNGKVVDSGKFFLFGLGNGEVIPGWEVGIKGGEGMPPMAVGGIRRLVVPSALAYGPRGAGCAKDGTCLIPPDATLEFTIELVSFK